MDQSEFLKLAIGPDYTQGGKLVIYSWHIKTLDPVGGCVGADYTAIKRLTPGSSTATEYCIPLPSVYNSANNRVWFGGAVVKNTGHIVFSSSRLNPIRDDGSGTSRYLVCDPANLVWANRPNCYQSGSVMPLTASDALGSPLGNPDWNPSAGLALDAEGNFYQVVRSPANKATFLIKVKPGAAGQPWYYQKIREITNSGQLSANSWEVLGENLAFADGGLYTAGWAAMGDSPMSRIDLLDGQAYTAGWTTAGGAAGMTSAAVAKTVHGHVWWDQDGDGQISATEKNSPVVGATVELYKGNSTRPVATTTTDGSGEYHFLYGDWDPAGNSVWYVRLKQPKLDGINARQTFAAGYSNRIDQATGNLVAGNVDEVAPRCAGAVMAPGYEGPCDGARLDGIDPSTGVTQSNVFTNSGANIVTRVVSQTDDETAVADFGITVAGSYGDAPAQYKTTRAQSGPNAYPSTGQGSLLLGSSGGLYANGTNDTAAAAHSSDDGVAVKLASQPDSAFASVQDKILAVGQSYTFRAKVTGSQSGNGFVKGWISPIQAGGATATTFSTLIMGTSQTNAKADAQGYVYADYTVPSQTPSTSPQRVFFRARAAADPAQSYSLLGPERTTSEEPAAGDAAWNTRPWARLGEVEDYGMAIATGTITLQAKTTATAPVKFTYALTNVSATAPSANTDQITTNADGSFAPGTQAHAFAATGTAITIATTAPTGWRLVDTVAGQAGHATGCYPAGQTTPSSAPNISGADLTVPASLVQSGAAITCDLTYAMVGADPLAGATLTVTPTPDAAAPLTAGSQTYSAKASLVAEASDGMGGTVSAPITGHEVTMTLTPTAPAPAGGAKFDNGTAVATCTTGSDGSCTLIVNGVSEGAYTLTASAPNGAGIATQFPAATTPANQRHPATLYFKGGDTPCALTSVIALNNTADKVANNTDYYTAQLTVKDCHNNGIRGITNTEVQWPSQPSSVTIDSFTEVNPTTSPGQYTARVKSTEAKTHQIRATVRGVALVDAAQPANDYVSATFVAGAPCDQATDPACQQGVMEARLRPTVPLSLTHPRVYADGADSYTVTVTLADSMGHPVTDWTGAKVHLSATPSVAGLLANWTGPVQTSPGTYELTLTSADVGTFVLALGYGLAAPPVAIPFVDPPGNAAVFGPGEVCTKPGTSSFTLDDGPKQSGNPASYYTATVRLQDCDNRPITDAVTGLHQLAVAPQDSAESRVTVSAPLQTTSTSGVYTAQIHGTAPGSYTVPMVATIGGAAGTVLGPQQAAFVGDASAGNSWFETGAKDGARDRGITVGMPSTAIDWGTITVHFATSDGSPIDTVAGAAIDPALIEVTVCQADGYCTDGLSGFSKTAPGVYQMAQVTSPKAGRFTVTVTYPGLGALAAKPTVADNYLNFIPGPVDWQRTVNSLQVQPGPAAADGVAALRAWVTVQDQHGNPLPGQAGPCFEFTYDGADGAKWQDGAANPAVNGPKQHCGAGVSDAAGQVEAWAVSIFATDGTDGFKVVARNTAAGTVVTNDTPDRYMKFTMVAVDADQSWWEVNQTQPTTGPAVANGSDYFTVTVHLFDANGHPVNHGAAQLVINPGSADGPFPADGSLTFQSGATGSGDIQLMSWVDGTWTLRVQVGGQLLTLDKSNLAGGSAQSADISFVPGPGVVVNSRLSDPGPTNVSFNDGIDSQLITATVRDSYGNGAASGSQGTGNLVPSAEVIFSIPAGVCLKTSPTTCGPATIAATTGTLGADRGVAQLELTSVAPAPTKPTTYPVTATLQGLDITTGSPAHARFIERPEVDPTRSTLEITTSGDKVAGEEPHLAKVTIRNLAGQVIVAPENQVPVTVRWRLATAAPSDPWTQTVVTTSNGEVSDIAINTEVAGKYTVEAWIGGVEIAGSPQTVSFVAGQPDWSKSTFTVTPHPVYANGVAYHTARVVVVDRFGNPLVGVPVTLNVDRGGLSSGGPWFGADSAAITTGAINTCDPTDASAPDWCDQPGAVVAQIRSDVPGTYQVTAFSGTNQIPGTGVTRQAEFVAGLADPAKSSWVITAPVPAPTEQNTTAVMAGSGDSYTLVVTVRSDANVLVPNAPVRLTLPDGTTALTTTSSPLSVDQVAPHATAGPLPDQAVWGTYSFNIASAQPLTDNPRVQVNVAGLWQDINGPAFVRFTAGPTDLAQSWLVEPGAPAPVGTPQPVQAQLRDSHGFTVADGTAVNFAIPAGATARCATGGPSVTGPDTVTCTTTAGSATVQVTSFKATAPSNGLVLGAKVGAAPINTVRQASDPGPTGPPVRHNGEVHLWWTAGLADPVQSVLSIPTADQVKVADNVDQHTARVEVADASGNPVAGQSVLFTFTPVGAAAASCSALADTSGVATCQFASTLAGQVQVRAYLGTSVADAEVSSSPKTAAFVAGPVSPLRTLESLETEAGAARADGSQARWARLTVQDQWGNPVAGQAVCFVLMWAEPSSTITAGPRWDNAMTGGTRQCLTSDETGVLQGLARSNYASPATSPDGYVVKAMLSLDGAEHWSADEPAKKVAFTAVAPVAAQSDWDVAPAASNPDALKVVANGSDSYVVVANLRNALGGPVYQGSAVVTVTPAGPIGAPYTITSAVDGTGSVAIPSLVAGSFTVTVSVGGDLVPTPGVGSGVYEQTIVFAPGDFSGVNSHLTSPPVPAVANGVDEQVISATVRDGYGVAGAGNLIPGVNVVFRVPAGTTATGCAEGATVTGSASAVCTMTTGSAGASLGVAYLTLRSTMAGTYEVTAQVGGQPITKNSPAEAVFLPGQLDRTRSSLVIITAGQDKIAGEETHRAEVTIRDAQGNVITAPLAQTPVTLTWGLNTDPSHGGSNTVDTVGGVATFDFTDAQAGVYVVTAAVPSGAVADSPQTVRFTAGALAKAVLTTSVGLVANDGVSLHSGVVTLTDAHGNPVAGTTVQFEVTGEAVLRLPNGTICQPGTPQSCTLVTSEAGLVQVGLTNTSQQTVQLAATLPSLPGVSVTNSPAALDFGPGAPSKTKSGLMALPSQPINSAHPCVVANGTDTFHVAMWLHDASDLPIGGAPADLSIAGPAAMSPPGPYTTAASGAGVGQVVTLAHSTKAGSYLVSALLGGEHVLNSPQTVTFCAGPMDSGQSFLTGPDTTAVADGTQTQVITATVLDGFENPIINPSVQFTVPGDTRANGCAEATTVTGPGSCTVVGDSSGVAALALTTTKAGTYEVTATVNGTAIDTGSPAKATFVAGPVDLAKSLLEVLETGPKVADGVQYYTVRVSLLDSGGNPVTQLAGSTVAFEFAKGELAESATATVSALGVAQFQFKTVAAGTWLASATYGSLPVAGGQQVPLVFQGGGLSLPDSQFWVSSSLALADGSAMQWVKVLLRDAQGNPLPGLSVQLTVAQGSPVVPGPWFGSDQDNHATTVTTCSIADAAKAPWCTEDGLAYAEIRSHEPGTFRVSAQVGGADVTVPGDFREVGFSAGGPDPARSSWQVTPDPLAASTNVMANNQDSYTLSVDVVSTSNIKVDLAAVRLVAEDGTTELTSTTGPLSINQTAPHLTGTPTQGVWGRYVFNVKSTTPGSYQVAVQVEVDGTWTTITNPAALATLIFKAGAADPDQSRLSITTAGQTKQADGVDQHTARVDVADSEGNPVTGQTVLFTFTPVGQAEPNCSATTDSAGVATCHFASTQAGEVTVRAYLGTSLLDAEVSGSPQTAAFVPGPVDPQRTLESLQTESGAARADGVGSRWARLTMQDQYGNPVDGATACLVLLWAEPDPGNAVGPRWDSAEANGSRLPSACETSQAGNDGVIEAKAYSFYASPATSPEGFAVKAKLDQAGTTHWSTVTKYVAFTEDAPVAAQSDWDVAPATSNPDSLVVVANGSDAYVVTANLRNAAGNPVYLGSAEVTVTPAGTAGAPYSITSGRDGSGSVMIKSTVAGSFTVSVAIGNDRLATPKADSGVYERTIVFAPGPFSAVTSQLTAPLVPAVANGVEQQQISATVRDGYGVAGAGNLLGGVEVVFRVPAGTTATGCAEGATVTGSASAVCTMTTSGAGADQGVAYLTLRSTMAGTYQVTAQVGGQAITKNSPAEARFVPGPVDPAMSLLEITTLPNAKPVGQNHLAKVTIRDAHGNQITAPTGQVEVSLAWVLTTDSTVADSVTNRLTSGGVVEIPFTATVAGFYVVSAAVPTGPVGGSGQLVQFTAGPPASAALTATTGRVPNDGVTPHSGTVVVRDQHGNPVPEATVQFTVTGDAVLQTPLGTMCSATTPQHCLLETSAAGQAMVYVVDNSQETVALTASLQGTTTAVDGSPANLEFGPDGADATTSTLSVAPTTPLTGPDGSHQCVVADGQDSFTATVSLRDAANLAAGGQAVGLTATAPVAIDPAASGGQYTTNKAGEVQVQLTSTKAGAFALNARLGANHITGSPAMVSFCAGPVDPSRSWLSSPLFPAVADGIDTQVVTASVVDEHDNPIGNPTVVFAVPAGTVATGCAEAATVSGPGSCTVAGNSDGVAELVLVSTVADQYLVNATVDGSAITGQAPAQVQFVPGPVDLTRSTITKLQPGPMTANGVDYYTVEVKLYDAHGNPATAEAGRTVAFRFEAGTTAEQHYAQVDRYGQASYQFSTTEAGTWQASAVFYGAGIGGGAKVDLLFIPGQPDVSKSEFTASPTPVLANGSKPDGASSWAKVVLKDAHGNPVPGQTVSFAVTQGSLAVPGPWFGTDPANTTFQVQTCDLAEANPPQWCTETGMALVQIRSDEPGTFQVSATWDGAAITHPGDFREIAFTAGSPDPARSSWQVSPDPQAPDTHVLADGTASYAITVLVRSTSGILVDNAAVRLDLAGLDALAVVETAPHTTGTPTKGVWGEYTFHVTSTLAGSFALPVQVNVNGTWVNIENPDPLATVIYQSKAVAPGQSSYTLEPTNTTAGHRVVADGADSWTMAITLRDANGAVVAGACASPVLPPEVTVKGQPDTGTCPAGQYPTNAAGQVILELVTLKANSDPGYAIGVTVAGVPVPTVQGGTTYQRYAKFYGQCVDVSDPTTYLAWLTSPAATAPADGVATLPVLATVTDVNGNTPHCFAPDTGLELPIEVVFQLPVNTSTGTGVAKIDGYADVAVAAVALTGDQGGVRATLEVSSETAATHYVTGRIGSYAINQGDGTMLSPGSAFQAPVTFTPGKLDPVAHSKLTIPTAGSTVPASANGATFHTAQVYVADGHGGPGGQGNPLAGVPVRLTVVADGQPISAGQTTEAVTGSDGTYTHNIASPIAGSFQVYAWVQLDHAWTDPRTGQSHQAGDWVQVSGSPQTITFVAGPVSHLSSTIETNRRYVEANLIDWTARGQVDTAVLTVVPRDALGNPVETFAGTVQVSAAIGQVALANGGVATRQANGTYTIEVASPVAGDVTFTFKFDAGATSAKSVQVKFVPTPAAPAFDKPKAQAARVSGQVEPNMWVEVVRLSTGLKVCDTKADRSGNWVCTTAKPLPHGAVLSARAVERQYLIHAPSNSAKDIAEHTFASVTSTITVKAKGPAKPVLDPSHGDQVTGHVPGYDPAEDGPLEVTITDQDTGNVICHTEVKADGTFSCTASPKLPDGTVVKVVLEDEAGNTSEAIITVVSKPPTLVIDPSDGKEITGKGDPGDAVVITDQDGREICSTTVAADGTWRCRPDKPLGEGDLVTIKETDPAGNTVTKQWRIGLPRAVVVTPRVMIGATQTVRGLNFQPGEVVKATMYSTPQALGSKVADANGRVEWTHLITGGTELGDHSDRLVGDLSGVAQATFEVYQLKAAKPNPPATQPPGPGPNGKLPFTGSSGVLALSGTALGALLAGWLLLLAGRRRRKEDADVLIR